MKHKRYRILKFENSYCEVQDLISNQIYKCFSLDQHRVGEIVYLYSTDTNIHTGNPYFKYSILNTYEVDKEYEFEIVNEIDNNLVIEDEHGNQFRIPKSFRKSINQTYIRLKIEKLDIDKNRLKFVSNHHISNVPDYTEFEFNTTYEFRIDSITSSTNGLNFVNSLHKGNKYSFLIPHRIETLEIGETVEVNLYRNKEGETKLNFTRKFIASKLFSIGEKYSFEIEEFGYNSYNDLEVWRLVDPRNNFKQDYYPSYDKSFSKQEHNFSIGDQIELVVTNITDKGFLYLAFHQENIYDRKQYIIEDIFKKMGIEAYLQEYFYDLEEFIEEEDENNFIAQYNEGSNLWLFSYFTLLDKLIYLELEDGEFIQVNTIIDIYIKLEKWMLLSGYITNFSPEKKNEIVKKAKQKNEKLIALKSAIDLYLQNENEKYVISLNDQLKDTPILLDDQKSTLIELFRISHLINTDDYNLDTFQTLYTYIAGGMYDENDAFNITVTLESKILYFKDEIIQISNCNDKPNYDQLNYFIAHLYLYQYFVLKNEEYDKAVYNTFNLINVASKLNSQIAEKYIQLTIELITNNQYLHISTLSPDLLKNISPEKLYPLVKRLPIDPEYINSGKAFRKNNMLRIIPGNHFHSTAIASSLVIGHDNLHLAIDSNFQQKGIDKNISAEELIVEVLKIHDFKPTKQILDENDFEKNVCYTANIKAFDRENKFAYVNTIINDKLIEFTVHLHFFDKFNWLNDITNVLSKGDQISFNILSTEERKVYIKFNREFNEKCKEILNSKDFHLVKIIKNTNEGSLAISENGEMVLIKNDSLIVGSFYEVQLTEYDENLKVFSTDEFNTSSHKFSKNDQKLLRKFLVNAGFIQESNNYQNKIFEVQLRFLLTAIESTITDDNDLKDTIIKFLFLYTISSILRNKKSYYYKQKLNNIYNILHITSKNEELDLIPIDEATLEQFENLQTDRIVFDLLNYFNSDIIEIPVNIKSDNQYYKAKKLIESYNLIKQYNQNQELFQFYQKLIISELLNNEKMIEKNVQLDELIQLNDKNNQQLVRVKTNLGIESKHQEFKSSFYYSASETKQKDIILRTINGFLNSFEGGSLFIGVNDDGDIIGLDHDLNFDHKKRSLDQYKNEIVSAINYGFPKEIGSLFIDFKFHTVNHLTYLEIEIKPYDSPIHYKNEFWLRQANRTTILKGNDLTDFFVRKMSINSSKTNDHIQTPSIHLKEINNQDEIVYKEDFYSEFKKEGEISNSLFTNHEDDYIVTLYIFNDNTYLISKDENKAGYLFKVRITESDKLNYLLMCYDNACVNKVDIRQIISKKLNRRYSNAMSDYGKLLATFIAKDSDHILIQTTCSNRQYVKIIHSNKITAHRSLGLKGNQIVQEEIDTVNQYLIVHSDLAESYSHFIRESKQGYGTSLNSNTLGTLERLVGNLQE